MRPGDESKRWHRVARMTFLAGDSLDDARQHPNADDLARQDIDGQYWWAGLDWFIRCDRCGVVTPYHKPDDVLRTDDRNAWEVVWIAWEAHGGGGHECVGSCAAIEGVQLDLLDANSEWSP